MERSAGTRARSFSAAASSFTKKNNGCTDLRTVAKSRPSFSHAWRKVVSTSPATSGVPQVFHSWANLAVSRNIRAPPVPTKIGNGLCTGFGSHGTLVTVKCSPEKDTRSSDNIRDVISIASAKRSTRSLLPNSSIPKALCSFTCQPAPIPNTNRPLLMRSMVAARFAISAG